MPSSQAQRIGLRKIVFILFMSASLWLALFAVASAEVISSFVADYEIHDDSSVTVTETIVYDFGWTYRHGIYRIIYKKHPQPASVWYKNRYIDIEVLSVLLDDQEVPYQISEDENIFIQIGDPDKTVAGSHEYEIIYRVEGALSEYPEGVELYWNVTGDEWDTTIENISAEVHLSGLASFVARQECYSGSMGDVSSCDNKYLSFDKAVFEQNKLVSGQELTIAQALDFPGPPVVLEKTNYFFFLIPTVFVWFVALGIWIYRWRTAYKPNQTIIPQYEPYQDFKPMFTGVLIDNKLDSRDISAGIVYLAQQGFISIKQTTDKVLFLFDSTDYEVTLNRKISEAESAFLESVLTLLFVEGKRDVGRTIKLSDIRKNSSRQIENVKIIRMLRKAIIKDMVDKGFLEQSISLNIQGALLLSIILLPLLMPYFVSELELIGFIILAVFIASIVILNLIIRVSPNVDKFVGLTFSLERRTKRGFEALNHLKGFKDFLSVTEKERYKFHNAPSLSPQQFMEYLPYAIAFGVEKEWAEIFKDIQIDNPDWYGSSTGSSFNAVSFTTGLGAFSTAFSSSTGSSGSSGSSGGGSSGGGGGGGGGGSW